MKTKLLGVDIGGTKCAVIHGEMSGPELGIVEKIQFPTSGVDETLAAIEDSIESLMGRHGLTKDNTAAIGISCGGPLDVDRGLIMSPPNLKGWNNIPITARLTERLGIRAAIQNDANACALAEWKFGAGRGCANMVFLTFGTGMGAGLILNGRLYVGTNGNAGEVGHIRLSEFGPVGYGKSGSFEGFCSGGGIAQLARLKAEEEFQMGRTVSFCGSVSEVGSITAESVAMAAKGGDRLAREVYRIVGDYLGRGISLLIDILNPECVVVGSIYSRSSELLVEAMDRAVSREALGFSAGVCRVVPAVLGENTGDFAALSVAANALTA